MTIHECNLSVIMALLLYLPQNTLVADLGQLISIPSQAEKLEQRLVSSRFLLFLDAARF